MAARGRISSGRNLDSIIGADQQGGDPFSNIERQVARYEELLTAAGKNSAKKVQEYRIQLDKKAVAEENKERLKMEADLAKSSTNIIKQLSGKLKEAFTNLGASLENVTTKLGSSINDYIKSYTQYMGRITTRLQGSGLSFNQLAGDVSRNLAFSPYLKQTDMLSNLNKFVEAGIAYNLESRAYIATATDKIAATFDAFDSSLLRIIRIQQADSTVARIGMESLLTKFLNARYEDTSYLSSTSKTVSSLLTEAESLMGYRGATEFEYAVQQWLGSMTALGVSSNTIQSIATGLGYLGSGNISALSGNTALQNLLVMAASNAGLDFGSLLTGGLNAGTANALLSSIVGIGQNIATSGNNVVRSQYASLFGLNVSDLVSLTNITAEDLRAISENIVSYERLRQETTTQISTMGKRTTVSEMVGNVFSNVMTSLGANVATNPALYGLWQVAELMASSGLDYGINVGFLGTGTSTNLSTIMKTGVIGASALTSLINAIGGLVSGSNMVGTSIESWGGAETRGRGLATTGSSGSTVSSSSYIGTVESGALASNFQSMQQETAQYVGEEEESELFKTVKEEIAVDVHNIYNVLEDLRDRLMFNPIFNGGGYGV